jgi:ATP-dependent RNA helicase DeaD
MQDFSSLGLPEQLLNSLKLLQFNVPTPIQSKVIPEALKGKDILGSAQTGSGKTGAFGIPLIAKLMSNPQGSALVMTPTRELAVQVIKMLESLIGKKSDIKTALLIGGESITKQFQKLRARPRLIVGTPGRINDHILRDTVKLGDVEFLVLDETDRMLDMGFTPQIDAILESVPEKRQTLLFSATLPKNIMSMSKKYLTDPIRISIEEIAKPVSTLKQETINISEQDKYEKLLEELEKREGSIIMFVKTKMGVDRLTKRLRQDGHSADAIHGDLSHNRREKAIAGFRMCKYRILVATDIASRGLDIPHIMHVINYDLPQCPEDYIHRIGRTARAGAEGSSLCFISPADKGKWKLIHNLINFGESPEQEAPNRNGGNRPFGNRDSDDRNFGNKPSFGKKPSFAPRTSERRKFDDSSSFGRDTGTRNFSDRPFPGSKSFDKTRTSSFKSNPDSGKNFSFSKDTKRESFSDGSAEKRIFGNYPDRNQRSERSGNNSFANNRPKPFKSTNNKRRSFGNNSAA